MMKIVKVLFGIIMCFALLATLISFFTTTVNQGGPEIIGHLILIAFVLFLIYLSFKPSKKDSNIPMKER